MDKIETVKEPSLFDVFEEVEQLLFSSPEKGNNYEH